jgi:glycerol-3-phosphate dehydrogenase subunit B
MANSLVIGAGLAGLTAAWQLAAHGHTVRLITRGWGALYWQAGGVDVLGYYPTGNLEPVASPAVALRQLVTERPGHPYALVGLERLDAALSNFGQLCASAGYPLRGSLDHNWLLPTAAGAIRPTCLASETMVAGDLSRPSAMVIVGFGHNHDFYPQWIAANLSRQGIPAEGVWLDLESLRQRRFVYATTLARMMEQEEFRAELVHALRPRLSHAERVGFPAVLGLDQAVAVKNALERDLGRPVFEIPGLPPSIPGMRLHRILTRAIGELGGRVLDGMLASRAETDGDRITAVFTEAAARETAHRLDRYVLATGGILGGGIQTGPEGEVREAVFDLPLLAPATRAEWLRPAFLDPYGQPIYGAGVAVDPAFRPLNSHQQPLYANIQAVGAIVAGGDYLRERSLDGVALASGYVVGALAEPA